MPSHAKGRECPTWNIFTSLRACLRMPLDFASFEERFADAEEDSFWPA